MEFLRHLWTYRSTIFLMARRELANRYSTTLVGTAWALVHPLATVLVFWAVFSLGFKAQGPGNHSFILYFLTGYAPWQLFVETLSASTQCVVANSFLVKKTLFPTEILPLVHWTSSSFTHAVLMVFIVIIAAIEGQFPTLQFFLLAYYYLALFCFTIGMSWLMAGLNVFSRDIGQAVPVVLNLWFWLTPVAWPTGMMPAPLNRVLEANPLYYVVSGYRSVIMPAGQGPGVVQTLYFCALTLSIFAFGAWTFRRLKPEFPDVL